MPETTSTPTPLAICIEDLDAPDEHAYLQCVALVGRQPGLRLDAAGEVSWIEASVGPASLAAELWVSLDQQLILYRPATAAPVRVRRSGRSLDAPFEKPVVLLDGDELDVGQRSLRVHVHGETIHSHAPQIFVPEPAPAPPQEHVGTAVRATAAALALGAVVGAGAGCPKKVEVREHPPAMEPVPPPKKDAAPPKPDAATTQDAAAAAAKPDLSQVEPAQRVIKKKRVAKKKGVAAEPIQVRVRPPSMPKPPPPPPPPTKPPTKKTP